MLFFNTLEWQKDLAKDQARLTHCMRLKAQLYQQSFDLPLAELLESGRALLFDYYMEEEELTFSTSSISRVFDYRQNLEDNHPELHKDKNGKAYIELLLAIDEIWQHTQAPVSELVKAGKQQLLKVNGEATYDAFKANTKKMPDLFAETKALVDSYLHLEVLVSVLDDSLKENKSLDIRLIEMAITELRAFAGRGLRFGFWKLDNQHRIPILDNLNVDSFVLPL